MLPFFETNSFTELIFVAPLCFTCHTVHLNSSLVQHNYSKGQNRGHSMNNGMKYFDFTFNFSFRVPLSQDVDVNDEYIYITCIFILWPYFKL